LPLGWFDKRQQLKKQIVSLAGLLQHATKVVKPGQTFVVWMHKAAPRLKKFPHVIKITKSYKLDLHQWHIFAKNWNGISFISMPQGKPLTITAFKSMPLVTEDVEHALAHNSSSMLDHPNGQISQSWLGNKSPSFLAMPFGVLH